MFHFTIIYVSTGTTLFYLDWNNLCDLEPAFLRTLYISYIMLWPLAFWSTYELLCK